MSYNLNTNLFECLTSGLLSLSRHEKKKRIKDQKKRERALKREKRRAGKEIKAPLEKKGD